MKQIPIDKCIKGRVYEIDSRNLECGVYDGKGGFIGIREKFGDLFLFIEYHCDQGAPYGTVRGHKDTNIDIPDDIELKTYLGSIDLKTKRSVSFKQTEWNGGGVWYFIDNEEVSDAIRPCAMNNDKLFKFLQDCEKELNFLNIKSRDFELLMQKRYPLLYKDMHGNPRNTLMAFGFDVGKGWYKLIANLSDELYEEVKDMENPPYVTQVKEKWGELVFSISSWETDKIEKIIEYYESCSSEMCEDCGNYGRLRTDRAWQTTLCNKCAEKK